MPEAKTRRYWDSCAFIALIAAQEGRVETLKAIAEAAERGETQIVTSALTLAEVIKLESKRAASEEDKELIRAYFEHEFIIVVPFTRALGEEARDLCWRTGIQPHDAVHVASARMARVDVLETYDGELLNIDDPPIEIREPRWEGNLSMEFEDS